VLSVRPDTNFGSDNKDYKGNDGFKSSEGTGAADIKTKRLFVTGLSFYTSEKTLRAAFQPFGELVEGTSATSKHQNHLPGAWSLFCPEIGEFCGLTVNRPGMLVHTVVEHPSSTLGSAKVGNSDCSKKEELVLPTDSKHDSAKFSEDSS
jgi:RNA recognition motif-containing protein